MTVPVDAPALVPSLLERLPDRRNEFACCDARPLKHDGQERSIEHVVSRHD